MDKRTIELPCYKQLRVPVRFTSGIFLPMPAALERGGPATVSCETRCFCECRAGGLFPGGSNDCAGGRSSGKQPRIDRIPSGRVFARPPRNGESPSGGGVR